MNLASFYRSKRSLSGEMSKLECVIHYEHLDTSKDSLTALTEEKLSKLNESKDARKTLGGDYIHKKQIEAIPVILDSKKHAVHRKCYQKFTNAISVVKRKNPAGDIQKTKRPRRSVEFSGTLLPEYCWKCKSSNAITVKGKKQFPQTLTLESACETVKLAAKLQNDEELLRVIVNEDLIAKELKMHKKCYRDYTRICTFKETSSLESSPIQEEQEIEVGRFDKLCQFVRDHVIEQEQSVSIKLLTEVYGLDKEDCRLRGKVKQKLLKEFKEELLFITITNNEAQIVVSSKVLTNTKESNFITSNKSFVLREAGKIIKSDVVALVQSAPALPWPPTVESLLSEVRQPPESLKQFLTALMHSTDHSPGEEVKRFVDSFSQDIIHAISKGNFLTAKHVLLGCGLHSITGMKKPINILSKFGHSCNYNTVQEIETAQAELAQKLISLQYPLPLLPVDATSKAQTFFWWDNFDCKKETKDGSVHTCHGVAFQEESEQTKERNESLEVPKSGKRTVSVLPVNLPERKILPHKEPSQFQDLSLLEYDDHGPSQILLCWNLLRQVNSGDRQAIARFVGWIAQATSSHSKQTRITFLPPIRYPISNYSTVLECIVQSQKLARASNMKYTHITVDAGAAAKFYHVVWNNPVEFKEVLIHIGDFHGMVEFFSIIGKIIQGSGFEEIVYQAGLCTSGGINGVISGKHYNRSWMVHESFAEALERLFCESQGLTCPDDLKPLIHGAKTEQDCERITSQDAFKLFEREYEEKRSQCLQGNIGKTAQFWMMYLQLLERQHKLHLSINMNDFELRLHCWKEIISLCFSTNKQNYARYGAYYCIQSENLDSTHPGAKEELQNNGLSVCRNNVNIRQSIDGAGEQTFMKSSKTVGGIKNFVTQDSTYEKWVHTRPFQAKFVDALLTSATLNKQENDPRKCLRESEIKKSEQNVLNIMGVMKNEFINPFSTELDRDKLYNLASGCPLPDDISERLLSVQEDGELLRGAFYKRLDAESPDPELFFSPIKRVQWKGFTNVSKKLKVTAGGKSKEITAQRNILGLLAAKSQQHDAAINMDKALSYPLASVPLAMATCDGMRRKTAKSKLFAAALKSLTESDTQLPQAHSSSKVYVLDLAAIIRSVVRVPNTFHDLALQILSDIPKHYGTIYIACDTYNNRSIKNSERNMRGESDKFVIRSAEVRIPADFKKFLSNGDNKERMFELIEKVWIENGAELGERVVYFARGNKCVKIFSDGSVDVPELETDHEEADTKIAYLLQHAARSMNNEQLICVVRSSSGDIDIPIILLGMDLQEHVRIFIDNGSGKSRRLLELSLCDLTEKQRKALVGMHAFTGNDYVASFLRKGKQLCWRSVYKDEAFLDLFGNLGTEMNLTDDMYDGIERYVCRIYGERRAEDVNDARSKIFWNKLKKENKVIDISLLPPCKSSLRKHAKRANYVARMWRKAPNPVLSLDDPQYHGWLPDMTVDWVDEPYPEDVSQLLLMDDGGDSDTEYDENYSSSSDDE